MICMKQSFIVGFVVGIILSLVGEALLACLFLRGITDPYEEANVVRKVERSVSRKINNVLKDTEAIFAENWSNIPEEGLYVGIRKKSALHELAETAYYGNEDNVYQIKKCIDQINHPKRLELKFGSKHMHILLVVYPIDDDISDIADIEWIGDHIGIRYVR